MRANQEGWCRAGPKRHLRYDISGQACEPAVHGSIGLKRYLLLKLMLSEGGKNSEEEALIHMCSILVTCCPKKKMEKEKS